MKKKLTSILLIDDDRITNFLNETIIKSHGCCETIIVKTDGQKAIDFLKGITTDYAQCPELIFLDINMPYVNGWEFLELYKELPQELRSRITIVMLSSSMNKYDKERAEKMDEVAEFRNKPLTKNILGEVIDKYFQI